MDIEDPDVPTVNPPDVDIEDPDVPTVKPPEVEIKEKDVPRADVPQGTVEIADPSVPLADVPTTGDNSLMWTLLALTSATGLAWMVLENKKRKDAAE